MKNNLKAKSKGRIAAYLLLVGATVALMMTLRGNRRMPQQLAAAGDTLRVAMQYAPGSFYMHGDSLDGVDYRALRSLPIAYRIIPITTAAEGLRGLQEGRYDVVVADYPQGTDSMGEYIFTAPIYTDRLVLVQRPDSASMVRSPGALDGRDVYVSSATPMSTRLRHLMDETGVKIHIHEVDLPTEHLLLQLASGSDSVRYVVANEGTAQATAQTHPALDHSLPLGLTQFQPWILHKRNAALRDSLNRLLSSRQRGY